MMTTEALRKVNIDIMIASFDLLSLLSWSFASLFIGSLIYNLYLSGSNRRLKTENKILALEGKEKDIDHEAQKLSDQDLADRLRALASEQIKRRGK